MYRKKPNVKSKAYKAAQFELIHKFASYFQSGNQTLFFVLFCLFCFYLFRLFFSILFFCCWFFWYLVFSFWMYDVKVYFGSGNMLRYMQFEFIELEDFSHEYFPYRLMTSQTRKQVFSVVVILVLLLLLLLLLLLR